nr:AAA family ATPase [Pseudomonas syringae group genomosp. 7]
MRLDHLHLQNFRCYEDAHFDFQPGFNLVVGVNGSGKTSLLQGVACCFRNFLQTMDTSYSPNHSLITETDARFTIVKFEDRIRFERNFPLKLSAKGDAFDFPNWDVSFERNSPIPSYNVPISLKLQEKLRTLDSTLPTDLPVLAFYKSNRRWLASAVSPEHAAQSKPSRLNAYTGWLTRPLI